MKKKLLAMLLVLAMFIQIPVSALAANVDTLIAGVADSSANEQEEEIPTDVDVVNFELQLQNDFPIKQDLEEMKGLFLVTLHDERPSVSQGEENHYDTVCSVVGDTLVFQASNVPVGEYTLHMNAEYYFNDFTQKVNIQEGTKTTLVFSNSYTSYRGEGKTSPGVFALGDVNGDCVIDEMDIKILLEHMGQTSTKPVEPVASLENPDPEVPEKPDDVPNDEFESIYDLTLDGKTDILDLSILAYNMNKTKQEATPIVTVMKSAVKVEKEQEKAVPQGDRKLDTIMEDAVEPIQIAPKNNDVEISEENPIEIEMELANTAEVGGMVISAPAESGPTAGTIKVETVNPDDPNGEGQMIEVPIQDSETGSEPQPQRARMMRMARAQATAIRKADGSIEINLGTQIAIKKVTIVVTATAATTNLTEIAKVEFLNDMESRIPEPELNIPQNIEITGSGDSFTVTWDPEVNVTGYEVAISAISKKGQNFPERTYKAGVNQIVISSFEGGDKDKVTPLWDYFVRVKSTNGSWSSPYSEIKQHHQLAGKAPDAPDNVSVNGKFRQLDVSWKDMTGTEKYTLEYREKKAAGEEEDEWTVVHEILTNTYKITGLKDNTTYQVRVYGWNTDDNGAWRRGGYSLPAIGKTTSEVPQFSKYNMVDRDEIESIAQRGPLDASKYPEGTIFNPEWLIDDDYTTYFHSTSYADIGATVTFKEEQWIKEIVATNRLEDGYNEGGIFKIYITATDAEGHSESVDCTVQSLHPTAKNTTRYILSKPVKAKTLAFGLHKYYNAACNYSEIKFFKYDSLEDDTYDLYADDMHVTLKDDVTLDKITALRDRANTIDAEHNEYHPKKDLLLSELEFAEELLTNGGIDANVFQVKPDITKTGLANNFQGGLNGRQPLGYVAQSGNKINVYVGQKGKTIGQKVDARLVFTQYHAEAAAWQAGEITLYQGKNEIEVPNVSSLDFERGGSLYIVHTSTNVQNNPIQVRISGATKIPLLDLHRTVGEDRRTVDEAAWKATIRTYVEELVEYNRNLRANHDAHQESVGGYEFGNGSNCFLNSTEISLDNVFMSVPASQILNPIGGVDGDIDAMTDKLYNSMIAMNQMIELFYKERGFNPGIANTVKGTPTARFNIRYHRMFAGAFMYAGGLHLGIEWGSVPGLTGGNPITTDENGKRTGGNMFGWGIAHEMGHNADASGVSYAEVTNNIWSQFEKTWDSETTSRIPYEKVYSHVTSNTEGKPSSVFAQLGMYWQLHLAYDTNYAHYDYYNTPDENGKYYTEANYNEMLANEFFARYYLYRRSSALAPQTELTFAQVSRGTVDQNIMRTACAASQKDLTDFFVAWGLVPDADTIRYAAQFPKETRKIQYINDAAHAYTLANGAPMTSTTVNVELEQGVNADARKVTLTIQLPEESNMDAILGYEIIRNGQSVAFVEPTKNEDGTYAATTVYTDIVETQNNRVMTYGVRAYDKYLNETSMTELEPIKIRHEGDLPTDKWSVVSTNTISDAGLLTVYDNVKLEEGNSYKDAKTGETVTYTKTMDVCYLDKDTGETLRTESAAGLSFDGDNGTAYNGTTTARTAQMVISLGGKQEVIAIAMPDPTAEGVAAHHTLPWKYVLEFSADGGKSYTKMSSCEAGELSDGRKVLYFKNNGNIKAFAATHVRITAPNNVKTMGFAELTLLGPSGDNVDIGISTVDENGKETWNTDNAIGILDEDYVLDAESGDKIPAGSFVVTGKYTGNAAYNVVKLYNQNHKMYDNSFENKRDSIINGYQVFFADMPDEGSIVNVKDGFWVYWLEPLAGENEGKFGLPGAGENDEDIVVELPTSVYAELYRVDDALTLAGERLVSDSFMVQVPETLPTITLTNKSGNESGEE